MVSAHEPGHGIRIYRVDSLTGEFQACSPEGIHAIELHVLPDGESVASINADDEHWIYPLTGGDPRPAPGLQRADRIVRWMREGDAVLIYRMNELPARIWRVDLATGQREVWRELTPST